MTQVSDCKLTLSDPARQHGTGKGRGSRRGGHHKRGEPVVKGGNITLESGAGSAPLSPRNEGNGTGRRRQVPNSHATPRTSRGGSGWGPSALQGDFPGSHPGDRSWVGKTVQGPFGHSPWGGRQARAGQTRLGNADRQRLPVQGREEAAGAQQQRPLRQHRAPLVDPVQVAPRHVRHPDGSRGAVEKLVPVPGRDKGAASAASRTVGLLHAHKP